MEYDYCKLQGKIVEKYGTQSNLANAMKLSERSLSLKLNSHINFKQSEILLLCELLKIPKNELQTYFFKLKG